MQNKNITSTHRLIYFSLALLLISGLTYAQLGERAGPLNFNVPVNGSQTNQWYLINEGNVPINFYIYAEQPSQVPNEITPSIITVPLNGTIAPYSTLIVNVSVSMPANNIPHKGSWSTILQAIETSSSKSTNGANSAQLYAGIAKEMFIASTNAIPITTTTPVTTTVPVVFKPSVYQIVVVISLVIVIVILYIIKKLIDNLKGDKALAGIITKAKLPKKKKQSKNKRK